MVYGTVQFRGVFSPFLLKHLSFLQCIIIQIEFLKNSFIQGLHFEKVPPLHNSQGVGHLIFFSPKLM